MRCYAEKHGALWVAVCIDLSLAAQAESLAEARRKLDAQIKDYVLDALVGDDPAFITQLSAPRGNFDLTRRRHRLDSLR